MVDIASSILGFAGALFTLIVVEMYRQWRIEKNEKVAKIMSFRAWIELMKTYYTLWLERKKMLKGLVDIRQIIKAKAAEILQDISKDYVKIYPLIDISR